MRLTPQATALEGVSVVHTRCDEDSRGSFTRFFCEDELRALLAGRRVAQINHSSNKEPATVRGLHFQFPPRAEMKLIRCIRGRVWDVAVDLRKDSATFLQWHAEELSADNRKMLVIPEGCAHGYQVLEADSELLYLHTAAYSPEAEGRVAFDDERLRIAWPLPPRHLSQSDLTSPRLDGEFGGIEL